jgi:hypothetical protein
MKNNHNPMRARFWEFVNDDWVRITVENGKPLRWGKSYHTDEGWGSESMTWEYDGQGVMREIGTDGRDCDGRHSTFCRQYAAWYDLESCVCVIGFDERDQAPICSETMFRPHWTTQHEGQRDYSAEAMGY